MFTKGDLVRVKRIDLYYYKVSWYHRNELLGTIVQIKESIETDRDTIRNGFWVRAQSGTEYPFEAEELELVYLG